MDKFNYCNSKYNSGEFYLFNNNREGILWLKVKDIRRKSIMKDFLCYAKITLKASKIQDQFEELFNILSADVDNSDRFVSNYLIKKSAEELALIDTEAILSELNRIEHFEWGGDYKNSLDKFIINNYVKTPTPLSLELIVEKLENEINPSVKGYFLNSWYNYWSSILIEHLFKQHPNVLPTIGKIKNVDFFIHDIPFDLKVTNLPHKYLRLQPKGKKLSVIIEETESYPQKLIKHLYEEQGDLRFGSENRLFIVLIDSNDLSDSWKLKRNIDLLRPAINNYLDHFSEKNMADLSIKFNYKGNSYQSIADIIFITQ